MVSSPSGPHTRVTWWLNRGMPSQLWRTVRVFSSRAVVSPSNPIWVRRSRQLLSWSTPSGKLSGDNSAEKDPSLWNWRQPAPFLVAVHPGSSGLDHYILPQKLGGQAAFLLLVPLHGLGPGNPSGRRGSVPHGSVSHGQSGNPRPAGDSASGWRCPATPVGPQRTVSTD